MKVASLRAWSGKRRVVGLSIMRTLDRARRGTAQTARIAFSRIEYAWVGRARFHFRKQIAFSELMAMSQIDSLGAYAYALHYYRHELPETIRNHRRYFRDTGRGFGEDAFHTAWWLLFEERRPRRVLEIGVYRGQVISLWSLIASILDERCEVHGLSPFEPVGDSVSEYAEGIDYKADTLAAFERFHLNPPTLVCSFSTEEVARRYVQSIAWDLVYVDGNHEYDVVSRDIELALGAVRPGGLVVVDDAARFLPYRPPRFAFAGHEGPSRATMEVDPSEAARLGHVGHMVFLERRSDAARREQHRFRRSANKSSEDVEH